MTADTIGGVWNYSIDLIGALEQYGIETALLSMGRKLDNSQRKQIAKLRNLQLYETDYKLEWMDDPWNDVEAAGRTLLEIENIFRPDIIHLNGYSHACLNFNAPVLVVAHSCVYSWYEAVFNKRPPAKWNKYYENVLAGLRSANIVTAPTGTMIKSMLKIYGQFNYAEPVHNARNTIAQTTNKKMCFIFTSGRLWDEAKNIAALDCAAQKIKWPIYAAGENIHPNGKEYKFKNITVAGFLNHKKISEYNSKASIFVLAGKYEPFGLSALEAASEGCALVLSDIPSFKEIWQDCALYVNPDKSEDIASKVNSLINDKQKLKYYGQKAQNKAKIYSIEKMSAAYLNIYCKLLKPQPLCLTN
ncbi:MAG: hypothetical protein A2Y10_08460 [Planctomycetes bacterium GWF2_41_51]|nr:MAG: hypothetical protein A2Y10_08460 [Planctomycetes bacterium GWF2_41_51]